MFAVKNIAFVVDILLEKEQKVVYANSKVWLYTMIPTLPSLQLLEVKIYLTGNIMNADDKSKGSLMFQSRPRLWYHTNQEMQIFLFFWASRCTIVQMEGVDIFTSQSYHITIWQSMFILVDVEVLRYSLTYSWMNESNNFFSASASKKEIVPINTIPSCFLVSNLGINLLAWRIYW